VPGRIYKKVITMERGEKTQGTGETWEEGGKVLADEKGTYLPTSLRHRDLQRTDPLSREEEEYRRPSGREGGD